jgi:hypothetical protein
MVNDINIDDETPLAWACLGGNFETCKALLELKVGFGVLAPGAVAGAGAVLWCSSWRWYWCCCLTLLLALLALVAALEVVRRNTYTRPRPRAYDPMRSHTHTHTHTHTLAPTHARTRAHQADINFVNLDGMNPLMFAVVKNDKVWMCMHGRTKRQWLLCRGCGDAQRFEVRWWL